MQNLILSTLEKKLNMVNCIVLAITVKVLSFWKIRDAMYLLKFKNENKIEIDSKEKSRFYENN